MANTEQTRDHLNFVGMSTEERVYTTETLTLILKERILTLEFQHKKICSLKDSLLASLEVRCHILAQLNELTNRVVRLKLTKLKTSFSTFKEAIGVEVELRLRQIKELRPIVRGDTVVQDFPARSPNYLNIEDNMKRMEVELRCGICSDLMVSATSLNCMHTFCKYCISQWKNLEIIRGTVARCPACREPTTSERRNFLAENLIEIMVNGYSEEEKNIRRELVAHHQEQSQRNNVFGPVIDPSGQPTNHIDQFVREIEIQFEDIFLLLVGNGIEFDRSQDAVTTLLDVPLPQPNLPVPLPSSLIAAVIPVPVMSETEMNQPFNQLRVTESAQSDGQSRLLGILGPRAIQRINRRPPPRTNQSSARSAAGRKLQGTSARPRWRY